MMLDHYPMTTAPLTGDTVLLKSKSLGFKEALFTSPYEYLTGSEMEAYEDHGTSRWFTLRQDSETPAVITDPEGWAPTY